MIQIKSEQGNIALFVLGMLGIMMVLFVFVINMGLALTVKEDASTTVQQASMAASSVLYENVREVIYNYEEDTLEGAVQAFFKDIEEKVEEKAEQLSANSSYSDWSNNEIELEAFDIVLEDELDKPVVRTKLMEVLQKENIEEKVINMAKQTIVQNDGELNGAELAIHKNRIYIRASNELESTSYDGFMEGIKENIYQDSAGPKIDFLEDIWTSSKLVQLN
ncbi:Tad domain-containing protein [Virgibacillus flavescens]|uniref:Tad domain-containing protein n=1 Tax=Virgibacillus flavescens TaxID=1611422 RepID=UPI003D33FF56